MNISCLCKIGIYFANKKRLLITSSRFINYPVLIFTPKETKNYIFLYLYIIYTMIKINAKQKNLPVSVNTFCIKLIGFSI